ncbi:MAG: tyrosine-type recombinase/integrase [Planctomycetota bacterium]
MPTNKPLKRAAARSPRHRVSIRERERQGRSEFYAYIDGAYCALGRNLLAARIAADQRVTEVRLRGVLSALPPLFGPAIWPTVERALRLAVLGAEGADALRRSVASAELELAEATMHQNHPGIPLPTGPPYGTRMAPQATIPAHYHLAALPMPRKPIVNQPDATITTADGEVLAPRPAPITPLTPQVIDLPDDEALLYSAVRQLDAWLFGGSPDQVDQLRPLVERIGLTLHAIESSPAADSDQPMRLLAYRLLLTNGLAVLSYAQPAWTNLYREALGPLDKAPADLDEFVSQHCAWIERVPDAASVSQSPNGNGRLVNQPAVLPAHRVSNAPAATDALDPHLTDDVWPAVVAYMTRWQERTRANNKRALDNFVAFCAEEDIPARWSSITNQHVRAFTDYLRKPRRGAKKGMQSKQIDRRVKDLHFVLSCYLQATGAVEQLGDPAPAFLHLNTDNPRNRTKKMQPQALREEHILPAYELASQADLPRFTRILVAVALHLGLRKEGLSQLSWTLTNREEPGKLDNSGKYWVFYVEEKGKNGDRWTRAIPVPSALQQLLEEWHAELGKPRTGSLWGLGRPGTASPGSPLQLAAYHEIGKVMKRLTARFAKKFDVPYKLHDLRRTCMSRLTALGFTEPIVNAWIGHKNPGVGTASFYIRIDHADFQRVVDTFDPLGILPPSPTSS